MYPIEEQTINWIQKNWIQFHRRDPRFSIKRDGISESLCRKNECLWSTYMTLSNHNAQREDFDEDDILEANFMKLDITVKAAMDIRVHAKVKKLVTENQFCFPMIPTSLELFEKNGDHTWAYKTDIDSQVTGTAICLYPPLSVARKLNIRYSIAVSIFSHATRLLMLGNRLIFEGLPQKWNTFRDYVNTINEGQYKKIFEEFESNSVKIPVASILVTKCINLVPKAGANFGGNFLVNYTISVSIEDNTTKILADKLLENIDCNENHGLYVFNITECPIANPMCEVYLPLLICKDGLCFQTVAAVYKSTVGEDSFRLVTRSMKGLCDNMYMWTNFSWNTINAKWNTNAYQKTDFTRGKVFPVNIRNSFLSCVVLIPTRVQKVLPLDMYFSHKLNSGVESMDKNWSVNDYISFDEENVLTDKVLNKLVHRAMEQFKFGETNQSFIVSKNLIGDIVNFLTFAPSSWSIATPHQSASSQSYIFSSSTLKQFIYLIKPENSRGGLRIFHIFVPYLQDQGYFWVYIYYVYAEKTLVVMSTRENAVRNIMAIASSIKAFFEMFLKCEVKVVNLIWRKYLLDIVGTLCFQVFSLKMQFQYTIR